MKIGVLADCQYADIPDLHQEGRTQRFREVPQKLQSALDAMCDCDFIIHLGDIIQSQNCPNLTRKELQTICSIFESCPIPKIHVLGNHCIGTLPRDNILESLQIPSPGYYSIDLSSSWKCIVLDTTEMSGHSGYPGDSVQRQEAEAYLGKHPLTSEEPHMVSWNGGITVSQKQWLLQELDKSLSFDKKVVVCCHHQVNPSAARISHLAWNFFEILEVLSAYSSVVKLLLAGHDHIGGGCREADSNGNVQFFITVPAVLESPTGSNSYMILELADATNDIEDNQSCISVTGYGSRSVEIINSLFPCESYR